MATNTGRHPMARMPIEGREFRMNRTVTEISRYSDMSNSAPSIYSEYLFSSMDSIVSRNKRFSDRVSVFTQSIFSILAKPMILL